MEGTQSTKSVYLLIGVWVGGGNNRARGYLQGCLRSVEPVPPGEFVKSLAEMKFNMPAML